MGTDYPFNFHDSTPVDRVIAAIPDEAMRQALLQGNAARLLELQSVDA